MNFKSYFALVAEQYDKALEVLCSPDGVKGQEKITGTLKPGARCAWCYIEDVEFWRSDKIKYPHPRHWPYQGFIMPFPETDGRCKAMEAENVCVVITDYPIEKENPVTDWGALAQLIADPRLHRFYVFAEIKAQ